MYYNLNSLKGVNYIGEYTGVIKGDTGSLGYGPVAVSINGGSGFRG